MLDFILYISFEILYLLKICFFVIGSLYLLRRIGGALRGLFRHQQSQEQKYTDTKQDCGLFKYQEQ